MRTKRLAWRDTDRLYSREKERRWEESYKTGWQIIWETEESTACWRQRQQAGWFVNLCVEEALNYGSSDSSSYILYIQVFICILCHPNYEIETLVNIDIKKICFIDHCCANCSLMEVKYRCCQRLYVTVLLQIRYRSYFYSLTLVERHVKHWVCFSYVCFYVQF